LAGQLNQRMPRGEQVTRHHKNFRLVERGSSVITQNRPLMIT
jgi:hypothetical protein